MRKHITETKPTPSTPVEKSSLKSDVSVDNYESFPALRTKSGKYSRIAPIPPYRGRGPEVQEDGSGKPLSQIWLPVAVDQRSRGQNSNDAQDSPSCPRKFSSVVDEVELNELEKVRGRFDETFIKKEELSSTEAESNLIQQQDIEVEVDLDDTVPELFHSSLAQYQTIRRTPGPGKEFWTGQSQLEQQDVDTKTDRKQARERLLACLDPKTARKCMIAEHFFLDHYFSTLTYLQERKQRLQQLKSSFTNSSELQSSSEWKAFCEKESALLRQRRCRIKCQDFHHLVQIGQGGYGQVFLVRKKDTGELCALKKMNKQILHKMKEVQHILTERDVLTQSSSPWLVKLLYAFQDVNFVYLAMEYVPGGDMRTLLNKLGILKEKDARFYTAEMFTAVNELHQLGYIHRDIKPENFLIDHTGHVKLTDFGLSKGRLSEVKVHSLRAKLDAIHFPSLPRPSFSEKRSLNRLWRTEEPARAYSLVGSPDYMAPEVLVQSQHNGKPELYTSGYDYLVDYWSLGCILFEFLCGYPPFAGPTIEEVWVNVYHWQEVLERPTYDGADEEFNVSDAAWHLITSLITFRHERLQSIEQLTAHVWFTEFNVLCKQASADVNHNLWSQLRSIPAHLLAPPFVPQLQTECDHSHFDDFSNIEEQAVYKEVYEKQARLQSVTPATPVDRDAFVGWTFKLK